MTITKDVRVRTDLKEALGLKAQLHGGVLTLLE